jgi:hypothetical protein
MGWDGLGVVAYKQTNAHTNLQADRTRTLVAVVCWIRYFSHCIATALGFCAFEAVGMH